MTTKTAIDKISVSKKNIEKIFNEAMEMVKIGKKPSVSALMRKYGYTDSSARCLKVTQTKTWQSLLNRIDKEEVLFTFIEIMRDKQDKRARISAAQEVAKLLDLYPVQKSASIIRQYTEEVKDVFEAPEDKAPTEQPETE